MDSSYRLVTFLDEGISVIGSTDIGYDLLGPRHSFWTGDTDS